MSHVVVIHTQLHDPVAIAAACERLKLPAPELGTAALFSGSATGLIVRFPDWQYPVVIDTLSGAIHYDNYEGAWGDPVHLDRFLQIYAVERVKIESRKQGYAVSEQAQQDGSIKVQVIAT